MILAVTVCLVASALVVFFLFPRSVSIKQDKILETTVSINKNTSSTTITLKVSIKQGKELRVQKESKNERLLKHLSSIG